MYIKSINPPTIDQENYTLYHLKNNNPDTCFNSELFNGNYDNELLNYGVYRVRENPPILQSNQKIESQSIQYDVTDDIFYYDYIVVDKSDEELRQEKFNPIKFMESLADNLLFQQWASQASQSPVFSFMMVAYQNQKFDRVQSYYNALKASYPLPDNADIEWQELAQINGIPLTF
jgi:hypothetical protein